MQIKVEIPTLSAYNLVVCAGSYTWNGLDNLHNALQHLASTAVPVRALSSASPSQSGTAGATAGNGPAPGETWGSFAASGIQMQPSTPTGAQSRAQSAAGSMLSSGVFSTPGSAAAASEDGATSDGVRVRYTRKDKSLGLLSQRFIQLFLTSRSPVIALDDAAAALRGAAL